MRRNNSRSFPAIIVPFDYFASTIPFIFASGLANGEWVAVLLRGLHLYSLTGMMDVSILPLPSTSMIIVNSWSTQRRNSINLSFSIPSPPRIKPSFIVLSRAPNQTSILLFVNPINHVPFILPLLPEHIYLAVLINGEAW